jgi:predicted amidophosphoribosyltransferase
MNTGKFCSECGEKKPESKGGLCPECGQKYDAANPPKFCPNCGTKLQ